MTTLGELTLMYKNNFKIQILHFLISKDAFLKVKSVKMKVSFKNKNKSVVTIAHKTIKSYFYEQNHY